MVESSSAASGLSEWSPGLHCLMCPSPPADRGSSRRLKLHRGLLWRPADTPVYHQPDLQEATPVAVSTPGHAHAARSGRTGPV